MQPISVQAALVANAYEAWAESGAAEEDASTIAAQTLARSANSFLDQSFMAGLFDVYEAMKDPERSGHRAAGRFLHSLTPFSGFQRTVRDAMDPVQRHPKTVGEQVASGVPGRSEQVPPRITRFGEVVVREGGPVRRALDPFNASSTVDDPVAQELSRLGVSVTLPNDRIDVPGVRLTRERGVQLQQARGRAVRQAVEAVMSRPAYRHMPDVARQRNLEAAISNARRRATEQAKRELAGARR
jgi:hypothetical protein